MPAMLTSGIEEAHGFSRLNAMSTVARQDDAFAAAGIICRFGDEDSSGPTFEDHLAALNALGDQDDSLAQTAQEAYRTGTEHDEELAQGTQVKLDSELMAESADTANLSENLRTSQFQEQPVRQSNDGSGRDNFAPAQAEYDNGPRHHTSGISTFGRFAPSADSLDGSCEVPAVSTVQTGSMHGIGDDSISFGGHQAVYAPNSPRTRFGGAPLAKQPSDKRKVTESFASQDMPTKRRTMINARGHGVEMTDDEDQQEMWAYSAGSPHRQTLQEVLQAAQQPAYFTRPIVAATSQRWRPFVPSAPAHSTRRGSVAANDQTTTASAARMAFTAQTTPTPSCRPQLWLAKMTALPNSNTGACADRIAAWNPEMRSTDIPGWLQVEGDGRDTPSRSRFPVDDDSVLRHNNQARQQKEAMSRAEFAMYADWTETKYPGTVPEFDSYDVSSYPPPRDITVHDDTPANLGRSMVNFPPPEDQWFLSMAIQYVLAHNDETSTPADIWDMAIREGWAAAEGSLMPGSDVAGHARVVAALEKDQILKGRRRRNA
ncbi:hypothetical protein LTR15_002431 [Elasticomyces elasticus]|nr:hypothetical protein LTR15_002431 [Elasticomyces elasticus]